MLQFCLNHRVSEKYRLKAHELYLEYRDLKAVERYLGEEYRDTTIIVDTPWEIKDEELNLLAQLSKEKNNIVLALHNFGQYERVCGGDNSKFRWYVMEPCNSFAEADALWKNGAEYIVLGETLFFNIDRLQSYGIAHVRIMVNQALQSHVPRVNGICGPWARPEDIKMYDKFYKTVIEFPGVPVPKEEALYRIYAEQHKWPGELNMIIENIGVDTPNRMLPTKFTESRLNCRQRCNSCHICPNMIRLANRLIAQGDDVKLFLEKK